VCCPACKRNFCRECVTEHDERLLCAECLRSAAPSRPGKPGKAAWAKGTFFLAMGLLFAWLVFYMTGQALIRIPAEFHKGTAWQDR